MPGVDELTLCWWPGGRAVFATDERLFVGCCSTPDGPPRCKFFSSSSNVDNSIDMMSVKSRKEVSQMAADVFDSS